jgi:hypothetical protein
MVLKFYVYIRNHLMRFKNLTFLFITAIYSTSLYAVLLIQLLLNCSWLSHFPNLFSTWLFSVNYCGLFTHFKIIHRKIYAVTQKFPAEMLRR